MKTISPKYSHLVEVAFCINSDCESVDDIPIEQLVRAMHQRADAIMANAMHERDAFEQINISEND